MTADLSPAAIALRESEEKYRTLFEASLDAILLETLDGRILECNDAACALYGYSREELLNLRVTDLVPAEVVAALQVDGAAGAEELLRHGLVLEAAQKRRDGTVFPAEVSARLMPIHDEPRIIAYVRDIGARRRAEEALRDSEARFRSVADSAGDAILTVDLQTRIVFWNRAAESMFGYTAEEVLGRRAEFLIPESSRSKMLESIAGLVESAGIASPSPAREFVALRKDGTPFPAELSVSRWATREGEFATGIVRDVSARKQTEEALRAGEERYRTLVENLPVGVYRNTPGAEGRFLMANSAFLKMFGIAAEEELGQLAVRDLYADPAERAVFSDLIVAQGLVTGYELRLRKRDGSVLWGSVTARATYAETGGAALYFDCSIEDITARKRAEQARDVVYRISEAAHTAQNLDELYRSIHLYISELMPARNFYLALYDARADLVTFPYFVDEADPAAPPQALRRGLTAHVLRTGAPLLAQRELYKELVRRGSVEVIGTPAVSWLGVPLTTQSGTIGALVVQSYAEGLRFTPADQDMLLFVSTQVAMAIERKRTEEALAQERNLLRTLIDNLPDHIYAKDADSRFVLSNLANARVTGAGTPEALLGKTDFDLYPHDLAERYFGDDQRVLQSGQALLNREEPIIDPAGQQRWVLTNKVPLHGSRGEVVGLVGIGRDITAHKQHERELQALVEIAAALRAASTFADMTPAVVDQALDLFHAEGVALFLRDSATGDLVAERAAGSAESLLGMSQPPDEGLPAEVLASGRVYVNNDAESDMRVRMSRRLGPPRAAACVPLIAYEQPVGVLWIGRPAPFLSDDVRLLTAVADIAANALYRALVMSTLEQRVTERTHELAAANERLQELDRLKSKFVSDVSHELRTPLTNLKLYLNLVEHGRAEKQPQYLGIMREQVDRLTYLIEAILDLSRLESGRRRMTFAPVDLNGVVAQVVGEQRARAEEAGLALVWETAPDLPLVRGDRQALSQVITNLVANAISYTASGAVTIRTLPALECGRVCTEVQDTGAGIEPTDLPHVFERFYRGQHTAQSNIPGTGLGLAIVKELVELHGGRVEVESAHGKGATFRIWLPLAEFDN